MVRLRHGFILFIAVLLLTLLAATTAQARPSKVLLVVMDQMRPQYAKQYGMTNLLRLQSHGANFSKAWVGDMTAETVVSHNVMVSGLYPKNMGWTDEWLRDTDGSLGYGEGAMVTPGDFSYAEYLEIIEEADYPKIGDYLHYKFPGSVVACVGEKGYQVESMAASSADYWVRMGSKIAKADLPAGITVPWEGKSRGPKGNVPSYIAEDSRYYFSCGNASDTYGTDTTSPAWIYPEDGRYVEGVEGHESGDAWVADATMEIMENEDWSGLFVNFGAIDKTGHMWGGGAIDNLENYTWTPGEILEQVHLPWAAKQADTQLGRLIGKLKELGQFKDTLIVVLADHGATDASNGFYGVDAYDAGMLNNWYIGTSPNGGYSGGGNPVLKPLEDLGNVAASYQSTYISTWLVDCRWSKKLEAARVHDGLPGVIATYVKCGDSRYALVSTNKMTVAERSWWRSRGQRLVNTMVSAESPEVVSLLGDRVSYGSYGDHGGAQKAVQRIPMVFYAKGMQSVERGAKIRLIDVMPTILRAMGIRMVAPVDGRSYGLAMN